MVKKILITAFVILININLVAQNSEVIKSDSSNFRAIAELGFLSVLSHKIQFSNSGTYFNYQKDGGQDVLFPIGRISLEFDYKNRNTFLFLYQPLRIESQVLLKEDLIVDDLVFPAGTGVNLLYNFPFYRFSYLRELLPKNSIYKFAFGASIQLRNATISFESTDGQRFRTNRDLGIVPALKLRTNAKLSEKFSIELESDGIYAPVSYLNGSDNEVVGAILDASLRTYMKINAPFTTFLNLRYLGGGAVGTSEVNGPGDGYVKNWLHFGTVTFGFKYAW